MLGHCHPAPVPWMFCVSFKWEWNIFPFEFLHPGENNFSHSLKIQGLKKCFLGPKSPILDCCGCISLAVQPLILIFPLPLKSRAEIILLCVHPKCNPTHRAAVILPRVGISAAVGGRARGMISPIIQSVVKYNT